MTNLLMDLDDPLDFEIEDPLPKPFVATNKRKKVIGLDDLFNDHKKEQEKCKKRKSKDVKARQFVVSDDDDDDDDDDDKTETRLTEALQNFQKTIKEVDGQEDAPIELDREDVTLSWGLKVFGSQATSSPLVIPELGGCKFLQTSGTKELRALVDDSSLMGETFLRGLLLNGWLANLIIKCGYLEECIAKWTFDLLLYSSEESLMTSACDFWCAILMCNEVDAPLVKIEWLPGFSELKKALESFGFQLDSSTNTFPDVESPHGNKYINHTGSDCKGPPTNIRAWIKHANVCCQVRSRYLVFSTLEAEELVEMVVCLFLEQQLLGLSVALRDCLLSAINFFEDEEWNISCEKVAKSLADRVPRDSNCLRIVECISGVDTRSKQLRSTLAAQILRSFFTEMTEAEDILEFLISLKLKDKGCNLFRMYLYLVLTENWLIYGAKATPMVNERWSGFIWKCCSEISNTDFRPCAQEIRSRASYLLQSTSSK